MMGRWGCEKPVSWFAQPLQAAQVVRLRRTFLLDETAGLSRPRLF